MECQAVREALSAQIDGEPLGVDDPDLDAHLRRCSACRDWLQAAHLVTRRARLYAARAVPDRTDQLVPLLLAEQAASRVRVAAPVRVGLAVLAVAQLAATVPFLLLGHDHHAPMHVAHELGSFDVALAVGFAAAAAQPRRATGMRWLVGAAAVLLAVTATADLIDGHTDVVEEAPHLLPVLGWLLLHRLAHTRGVGTGDRPTSGLLRWRVARSEGAR